MSIKPVLEATCHNLNDVTSLVGAAALDKTVKQQWEHYCQTTQQPLAICCSPTKWRFYKPVENGVMHYSVHTGDFKEGTTKRVLSDPKHLARSQQPKSVYVGTKSEESQKTHIVAASNLLQPGVVNARIANTATALARENEMLQALQDIPTVVRHNDFFVFSQDNQLLCCLFQGWCQGGDLAHFLQRQQDFPLPERSQAELMTPLCHAIATMHAKGLLHKDIKCSNIGVVETEEGLSIQLFDFGTATSAESPSTEWTLQYAAPEAKFWVPMEQGYLPYCSDCWPRAYSVPERQKYDVFSVGIVGYKLAKGYNQWPNWKYMHGGALTYEGYRKRCIPALLHPLLEMDIDTRVSMAEAAILWAEVLAKATQQQ